MKKSKTHNLVIASLCLALTQILPFLTGQIPQLGNMLAPMHIPIFLCGFLCSPVYALVVGFTAPILRFFLFSMPPIIPIGIAMSFELATYGVVASILYKKYGIYFSLVISMITGRVVWGIVMSIIAGVSSVQFGISAFIMGAFIMAIPAIILQLILVPILVNAIRDRVDVYETRRTTKS